MLMCFPRQCFELLLIHRINEGLLNVWGTIWKEKTLLGKRLILRSFRKLTTACTKPSFLDHVSINSRSRRGQEVFNIVPMAVHRRFSECQDKGMVFFQDIRLKKSENIPCPTPSL